MGRAGLIAGLMLAASGAAALAQPDGLTLQPLDEWQIRRTDDKCVMSRRFGDPESPTLMELRNVDPWDGGFDIAISGPTITSLGPAFEAGWLPGGQFVTIDFPTREPGANGGEAVIFHHGLWDAARLRMSSKEWTEYYTLGGPEKFQRTVFGLSLAGAEGGELLLATGPMDGVIEARDACMRELLISKGIDPRDGERSDHRVRLTNRDKLASYLYRNVPPAIRNREKKTHVGFLFFLDEKGRPVSCRMLSMPYDSQFERDACIYMSDRARFKFKLGEAARPTFYKIGGYYVPDGAEPVDPARDLDPSRKRN